MASGKLAYDATERAHDSDPELEKGSPEYNENAESAAAKGHAATDLFVSSLLCLGCC